MNESIPFDSESPVLGPTSPPLDTTFTTAHTHDINAKAPLRQACVEDVPDIESTHRFVEQFPDKNLAGASFGRSRTSFDAIRDDQILRGAEILGPFNNDEEWQLAKWLIKNVGHNTAEEFLKLAVVSCSNFLMWQ